MARTVWLILAVACLITASAPPSPTAAATAPPVRVTQLAGTIRSVAVANDIAVIGVGPRLQVVRMGETPQLLGELSSLQENIRDIALAWPYAYVANGAGGLHAVDLSVPTVPRLVASYATDGVARSVVVASEKLYAGVGDALLVLTGPALTLAATQRVGSQVFDVALAGNSLYLAAGRLCILDGVSATLSLRGCWHDLNSVRVEVIGGFAYVLDGSGGEITPIDIRPAVPPVPTGPWVPISQFAQLMVRDGQRLFIAITSPPSMRVYDLSAVDARGVPTTPPTSVPLASMPLAGTLYAGITSSNRMYVAAGEGGLQSYATNQSALPRIGVYVPANTSAPARLAMTGQTLLVASADRITLYDVSSPASPARLGTAALQGGPPTATAVVGQYAYVAVATGVRIFSIANPSEPRNVGTLALNSPFDLAAHNDNLYITAFDGLIIATLANPEQPAVIGTFVATANNQTFRGGRSVALTANGSTAIVGIGERLWAVDLRNPTAPVAYGPPLRVSAWDIVVDGRYAYLSAVVGGAALYVIDLIDPANLTYRGIYRGDTSSTSLQVVDGQAYIGLAGDRARLRVVDLSNPDGPAGGVSVSIPAEPSDMLAAGGYLYVAAGSGGLAIYQFGAPYPYRLSLPLVTR
jgi:hypothetical protein